MKHDRENFGGNAFVVHLVIFCLGRRRRTNAQSGIVGNILHCGECLLGRAKGNEVTVGCLCTHTAAHMAVAERNAGCCNKQQLRVLKGLYEGWNFNSGNYLFTTDTK